MTRLSFHGLHNMAAVCTNDSKNSVFMLGAKLNNRGKRDLDAFKELLKTFPNKTNPQYMSVMLVQPVRTPLFFNSSLSINNKEVLLTSENKNFYLDKISEFVETILKNKEPNKIDRNFTGLKKILTHLIPNSVIDVPVFPKEEISYFVISKGAVNSNANVIKKAAEFWKRINIR